MTIDLMAGVTDEMLQSEVSGFGGGWAGPIIQWASGSPALAKKLDDGVDAVGGPFMTLGQVKDDDRIEEIKNQALAAGWVEDTFTTAKGEEISGFWIKSIKLGIVIPRRRWVAEKSENNYQFFPWSDFNKGKDWLGGDNPSSQTQIVAIIEGLEAMGPIMIALPGNRNKYFDMACDAFRKFVITPIEEASNYKKNSLPVKRFWLPLGPKLNEKGKVEFVEAGQKMISMPHLFGIDSSSVGDDAKKSIDTFAIDTLTWGRIGELFTEYSDWAKEWDSFSPQAETLAETDEAAEEDEAAAALAAAGMA